MNPAAAAVVAEFEAAARSAQQAEEAVRKKLMDEIAQMERRRAFAFRRTNLVRTLAAAGAGVEKEEAALAAQLAAVRSELGWSGVGESPAYARILERLQPVARAAWQCACGVDAETRPDVRTELETFETWFEGENGKSFYTLFDRYVPELPVVDF